MRTFSRATVGLLLVVALLAVASAAMPQAKPSVRIGYIPTDSFAAVCLLGDRHLPAAGVSVEMVPTNVRGWRSRCLATQS
jgi:ABC-type nitrate/sulfonate/bicarbonate transport system substrate-binding protein